MKAVVRRPLSGCASVAKNRVSGTVATDETGCVKVRPSAYDTNANVHGIESLEDTVQASASAAFILRSDDLPATDGVRAEGSSGLILSSEAGAVVYHYASARAASVLDISNSGYVNTPNEMENYIVMGITGDAHIIYGAKARNAFEIEPEGTPVMRHSASGSTAMTLSLPGDSSQGSLRTLGEMDGYTLGNYDGDTLDDVDYVPGASQIDPIIIHGGGE